MLHNISIKLTIPLLLYLFMCTNYFILGVGFLIIEKGFTKISNKMYINY